MSVNDIRDMSLSQRMELMEALWESFVQEGATSSPEWHREILEKRTQQMQNEGVKTYSLSELKQHR